jgi:hypothetical protein
MGTARVWKTTSPAGEPCVETYISIKGLLQQIGSKAFPVPPSILSES